MASPYERCLLIALMRIIPPVTVCQYCTRCSEMRVNSGQQTAPTSCKGSASKILPVFCLICTSLSRIITAFIWHFFCHLTDLSAWRQDAQRTLLFQFAVSPGLRVLIHCSPMQVIIVFSCFMYFKDEVGNGGDLRLADMFFTALSEFCCFMSAQ
jgi:hypothetical protein